MSELISGKDAKLAWANGADVEFYCEGLDGWLLIDGETFINVFDKRKCRLKPRTITINGVEICKPKSIVKVGDGSISIHFDNQVERNMFLNAINDVSF